MITKSERMESLYTNALLNVLVSIKEKGLVDNYFKKVVFYGVKMVISMPINKKDISFEEAQKLFDSICFIKTYMSTLTPSQFINIFPIDKVYDGEKWECKDYFYTMNYLNTLDKNSPIGDKIDELLWEYVNSDVRRFNMACFLTVDVLRAFDGKCSMMEEWADANGIRTLSLKKDSKGKEYFYDKRSHKTFSVKRPTPRYLKIVK